MRPRWLTRNVLAIGLVSLLTDASSEMIVPLLPVFLTTLGAGAAALGLIEGLAGGVAALLKLWSGRAADRWGRRRPLVVAGYTLSSLVRPLVALATGPGQVLAIRVLDRVGKGLRSSPRDALLTASVDPARRGTAFGFHRAMDHAGAFIGPLLAMAVLAVWPDDLRRVFALSAVPAVAAVLVVTLLLREAGPAPAPPAAPSPRPDLTPARGLQRALVPMVVFALGNASDTFLLLRAAEVGLAAVWVPLLWTGLHLVKSTSALPGGRLSDRLGPRATLALGWGLYVLVYGALAVVDSLPAVLAVILVYGVHHGLSEPAERVLVARYAPRGRGGEAFGWYHLGLGLAAVVASAGFGAVWSWVGPGWAFAAGAGLALVATALLGVLVPGEASPA